MDIFRLDSICITVTPVISPKLAAYLDQKGFSLMPKSTMDYLTKLINQILDRRRKHLERRNDFIQIMVDHEETVREEEQSEPVIGGLKKSNSSSSLI